MDKLDKNKLVIAGYKYHPQSGSTLILGFAPGKVRINDAGAKKASYLNDGFVVAWVAPGQRNIQKYSAFDSYHMAHVYFMRMKDGDPPAELPYTRDYQQQKVYEWQWKHIKGYHQRISMRKAKAVVQKISDEFNLRAPALNFRKDRYDNYCFYEPEKHEVGGHKRLLNMGNIIHECAHLVDTHDDRNIFQTHGPSFVKNLIMLAAKHTDNNDLDRLMKSAKEEGLLGLPEEIHYVEPPDNPVVLSFNDVKTESASGEPSSPKPHQP